MHPQHDGNASTKATPPRRKLHRRIVKHFCSSSRKADTSSDDFNVSGDEEVNDTSSPMRVVSPRTTAYNPSSPSPHRKDRTISSPRKPPQSINSGSPTKKDDEAVDVKMSGGSGMPGVGVGVLGPVVEAGSTESTGTLEAPVGQVCVRREILVTTSVGLADIPESSSVGEAVVTRRTAGDTGRGESDSEEEGVFETPLEEIRKSGDGDGDGK